MAEWNLSSDQVTIEPKARRSPSQWLRAHSLRLALVIGGVEALAGYLMHFRFLWAVGILAVFGYWYVRRRVPVALRRPLWIVAMSQAVAGLAVPALFGAFFIFIAIAVILLLMMALVLLGDLRRT
jgi:hypothetical protein